MLELKSLTNPERDQVRRQWELQQHDYFTQDLQLTAYGDVLRDFAVHKGVWNPFITLARYQATYLLFNNSRLFASKEALEIGTGSGLMSIVMALYGARHVVATDISQPALHNAKENFTKYSLDTKIDLIESNLFDKVNGRYDFIVFNHPFFCDDPIAGDTITSSMLAPQTLINRFLSEAACHMNPGAVIMMPFFSIPSDKNSPLVQGKRHGYKVDLCMEITCGNGMQKGISYIYELRK